MEPNDMVDFIADVAFNDRFIYKEIQFQEMRPIEQMTVKWFLEGKPYTLEDITRITVATSSCLSSYDLYYQKSLPLQYYILRVSNQRVLKNDIDLFIKNGFTIYYSEKLLD